MRKTKFANNEYYYIYNRGADKRKVFMEENDYLILCFLCGIKKYPDYRDIFLCFNGERTIWKTVKAAADQ